MFFIYDNMVFILFVLGRNVVVYSNYIYCLFICGKWFLGVYLNKGEICLDFLYRINVVFVYFFLFGNIVEFSIICWCCKLFNKFLVLFCSENNRDMIDILVVEMIVDIKWFSVKISLILLVLVNILYYRKF